MIWGVEGRHAWTPPGGAAAVLTLNRLTDDTGLPVWPRFKLTKVTGLMSLGDPEDFRDTPVGRVGEIPRLSYRRGKTVTYEGRIEARTLLELRQAEADLRAAFADLRREGRMDVSPHPLDTDWGVEPPKFFEARALTVEIMDSQDTRKWDRQFVIGVRMSDPRYFEAETGVATASISFTNTAVVFS